jgi:hypothetical protein
MGAPETTDLVTSEATSHSNETVSAKDVEAVVSPDQAEVPRFAEAPEPIQSEAPAEAKSADAPAQAPEQNAPNEQVPSVVESTCPPEDVIAVPASASPPPPGPVVVETPAQAHHILELIAAAVQRGALVGGFVPQGMAEMKEAPISPPEPPTLAPEVVAPTPAPENAVPTVIASPVAQPASAPAGPKTPAKIRITPRKIKPRPQTPPVADPTAPSVPVNDFPEPAHQVPYIPPPMVEAVERPAPTRANFAAAVEDRPAADMEQRQSFAQKMTAARFDLNQPSFAVLTPRERRNRWIGFSLSEGAAVTSLVLLGHFGFTHHFPDPTLKLLVFMLTFAAAATAVALPILFIRNNPARWLR